MRSHQIHYVLSQGLNRFEACHLVAKGVRATHKTGGRFEDSINDVLQCFCEHDAPRATLHPAEAQIAVKGLKPAMQARAVQVPAA